MLSYKNRIFAQRDFHNITTSYARYYSISVNDRVRHDHYGAQIVQGTYRFVKNKIFLF